MRLVIALGGNALLRRHERPSLAVQRRNMAEAAAALAPVLGQHQVVLTHGNGPQVGWLGRSHALPLDVLDAETEGLLGYLIEQELRNVLPGCELATLLTQVEVDRDDPAFAEPTKPIGPIVGRAEAQRREAFGERFHEEAGGWRRLVPSPAPVRLLGYGAVERLLAGGWLVICAGGGGIPVAARPSGGWEGVEAVVDKDATSALLARTLEADCLLLLTDVDGVYADWGTDRSRRFDSVGAAELLAQRFAAGSMGPKVEAACRFVLETGRRAAIGRLGDVAALVEGTAGTQISSG